MAKTFKHEPVMVSTTQAAAMYPCSVGHFQNLRSKKRGPRYFKIGRKCAYLVSDLEAFFTQSPQLTVDSLPEVR